MSKAKRSEINCNDGKQQHENATLGPKKEKERDTSQGQFKIRQKTVKAERKNR